MEDDKYDREAEKRRSQREIDEAREQRNKGQESSGPGAKGKGPAQ